MSHLKEQIESALSTFWEQNSIPATPQGDVTVIEPLVPLDSITACEALIDIEAIVHKELPVGEVVKRGGYATKEEFVTEVTQAVLSLVEVES